MYTYNVYSLTLNNLDLTCGDLVNTKSCSGSILKEIAFLPSIDAGKKAKACQDWCQSIRLQQVSTKANCCEWYDGEVSSCRLYSGYHRSAETAYHHAASCDYVRCGETINIYDSKYTGAITYPIHSTNYPGNMDCNWVIRFIEGDTIALHFIAFNIQGYTVWLIAKINLWINHI